MGLIQLQSLIEVWHRYRFAGFVIVAFISILFLVWSRKSRDRRLWWARSEEARLIHKSLPTARATEEKHLAQQDADAKFVKRVRKSTSRLRKAVGHEHASNNSIYLQPLVFHFSLTGNTTNYVLEFRTLLEQAVLANRCLLQPEYHDLTAIDYDMYFERMQRPERNDQETRFFFIFLVPSYNIDTMLDSFLSSLKEIHHDFRINTAPLSPIAGYSVFAFGDAESWPTVAEGFCLQGFEIDKWMAKLTAGKRAYPLGTGDVKSNASSELREWTRGLLGTMSNIIEHGHLGEGTLGSGDPLESEEEGDDAEDDNELENKVLSSQKPRPPRKARKIADLEDLGGQRGKTTLLPTDFTSYKEASAPKQMVPIGSPTYTALTKQGYTIIGSHSGVKICRWTKSALRGRGSCYKYSFYGIQSHLCMETTPSLSCSNKCVFCWRHGTNPVGTTWRWEVNPPKMIFEGAKEGHYQKIKMMRGVPGVRAERFQEAMRVRHCALSLVGEPIFYPHINDFVSLLHSERISSFLVCNAQHPDQLAALKPITQLYVSVDATNAESLRKIDRPLHRDFWHRFIRCLDILREKRFRMRTVFRLTLVKGFNIDEEVEGYADLVARGLPCFVEIKGVTYCGTSTSKSAGLTMQNVPFYEEIVAFVKALNDALERRGLDYGIAAEHAHSCCALIASRRFFVAGQWHTLIDYKKFFECWESGQEFAPEDYMGSPTPTWSLWGNGGFDPRDERVDRKGRSIMKQGEPFSH